VFGSEGTVAGMAAKLLLAHWMSQYRAEYLTHNGSAV